MIRISVRNRSAVKPSSSLACFNATAMPVRDSVARYTVPMAPLPTTLPMYHRVAHGTSSPESTTRKEGGELVAIVLHALRHKELSVTARACCPPDSEGHHGCDGRVYSNTDTDPTGTMARGRTTPSRGRHIESATRAPGMSPHETFGQQWPTSGQSRAETGGAPANFGATQADKRRAHDTRGTRRRRERHLSGMRAAPDRNGHETTG